MNKTILFGVLAGMFLAGIIGFATGCDDDAVLQNGKVVYPAEKAGNLFRVSFEGHTYIVRSDHYQGGICHDPDCPCMKKSLERKE